MEKPKPLKVRYLCYEETDGSGGGGGYLCFASDVQKSVDEVFGWLKEELRDVLKDELDCTTDDFEDVDKVMDEAKEILRVKEKK